MLKTLELPLFLCLFRAVEQRLRASSDHWNVSIRGRHTCTDIDLLPAAAQADGLVLNLRTVQANMVRVKWEGNAGNIGRIGDSNPLDLVT
jgi:hypothetical protein